MEVNPDKGINIGSNPFYRPSNSSYGSVWQASQGENPVKMGDIPQYPDVVSISWKTTVRFSKNPHDLIVRFKYL